MAARVAVWGRHRDVCSDDTALGRRYPSELMLPASDPAALRAFLEHPSRPAGTLSYHELQGFLFTVVSAPELVSPSDWLPIIFGEEEAGFASPDEAQATLNEIMALYNTTNAAVLDPPTLLPADCPLRDDVLANFDADAPLAQWSRGFLHGHQWLEELWEDLPEEMAEELDATLMALSFFSSRHMAEDFHAEATTSEQSFEAMADAVHRVVPAAVAQYAHMGRSIATVLAEHDAEVPEPMHDAKVGRNAPCPCGSGQKYKRCCGATVH